MKPVNIDTVAATMRVFIDRSGDIYVSDWNRTGRITKLVKTSV